jgi:hypothetical protein
MRVLRRIFVGVMTAGVLLGTSVGVAAASTNGSPNSCGDGGRPHAVHQVQALQPVARPFDGCPSAI